MKKQQVKVKAREGYTVVLPRSVSTSAGGRPHIVKGDGYVILPRVAFVVRRIRVGDFVEDPTFNMSSPQMELPATRKTGDKKK